MDDLVTLPKRGCFCCRVWFFHQNFEFGRQKTPQKKCFCALCAQLAELGILPLKKSLLIYVLIPTRKTFWWSSCWTNFKLALCQTRTYPETLIKLSPKLAAEQSRANDSKFIHRLENVKPNRQGLTTFSRLNQIMPLSLASDTTPQVPNLEPCEPSRWFIP